MKNGQIIITDHMLRVTVGKLNDDGSLIFQENGQSIDQPCLVGTLDHPTGVYIPVGHPIADKVINDFLTCSDWIDWATKNNRL